MVPRLQPDQRRGGRPPTPRLAPRCDRSPSAEPQQLNAPVTSTEPQPRESRRESVVLVYQEAQQYDSQPPPIRLRGLDSAALYRLDDGTTLTGAVLMAHGLTPILTGDYASQLIRLTRN
ncbi:GH36 C-terminal domain-containing protein [Kribbella qitaiheensis]|uniref:GH36 C-terminal domain-containing protein n=1 Tax=Kribbella qitaiheensis TaxID=1544730 RepID=UPI0036098C49